MDKVLTYDSIVVGAGAAGLISAAYLSRAGQSVLLCEKEKQVGGLVSSFKHEGYYFDSGIRAFENSGIIFPMLKQLGIEMEFRENLVKVGIENDFITIDSKDSINDYEVFLANLYPENKEDIHNIIIQIKNVMKYMDVLYGIDNPLFLDYAENLGYIFTTILPWMVKYSLNINKAMKLDEGVNDYLLKYTQNKSLIDIITQHFFKNTPTFFALSYFGLYLDYSYPKGGTSVLAEKLKDYIIENKGHILTSTKILSIDINNKIIKTSEGKSFAYNSLIWACDSKTLYNIVNESDNKVENQKIQAQKRLIQKNKGGDSILTVYLGVNLSKDYFQNKCGPHLFYTPKKQGISSVSLEDWENFNIEPNLSDEEEKNRIKEKIWKYLQYTTFEVSCPVLRDDSLAPIGKTGLIISTLIDYGLVERISRAGWYEEFKDFCVEKIIQILNNTIFKGIEENIEFSICSTPLTYEKYTGNYGGAITGWAFSKNKMPSETRFKQIANSVQTPIEDIYQAGQWTFSPSGLPISILTGKLAADKAIKDLKTMKKKGNG